MDILDDELVRPVRGRFLHWREFMEDNVTFNFTDSKWHTTTHCARVLLLSQVIGHALGVEDQGLDALAAASVFHDSRRANDGYDVGHGLRAAAYYEEFCAEGDLGFDRRVATIMAYHDHNDVLGIEHCEAVSDDCAGLYCIFKDSDGLDRLRLGPTWLDPNRLRTDLAPKLIDFENRLLASM